MGSTVLGEMIMDNFENTMKELPHESSSHMMSCKGQYCIPDNYNPADHPPVKMRNNSHSSSSSDLSETQRKRRSKNRLSNRRSTGYVNESLIEEAMRLGPDGTQQDASEK